MAAYMSMLLWMICGIICYYIAKARKAKFNILWSLVVAFFRPVCDTVGIFCEA